MNAPSNKESGLNEAGLRPIWLSYDGNLLQLIAGLFETRCFIDSKSFPFDKHQCVFRYFNSKYTSYEVSLITPTDKIPLDFFMESTEWIISDTASESVIYQAGLGISSSGLENTLTISRRPVLEIINTLIPGLVLVVLNLAACFVPPSSGERLSFSITSYLAYIFMNSTVQSVFPPNALNISFLSYTALVCMAISTTCVIWSVIVVRICQFSTEDCRIPGLLQRFTAWRKLSTSKIVPMEDIRGKESKSDAKTGGTQDTKEKNADFRETEITWADVADCLDKIFFSVLSLLTFIVCLVYMLLALE